MTAQEIRAALAAPFPADQIGWKPQAVKGNRAMAIAYIDSRNVMDRLDEVVGPADWQDEFTPLPDGSVVCRLSVRVAGEWVAKVDVGSTSEQPDAGDRMKAAFSDALKRAAVKWGIGRYLYELPSQWCDYDPQRRAFAAPPRLPDWAVPGKVLKAPPPAARPDPTEEERIATAHARAIETADTLDALKAAFDGVNGDRARLSEAHVQRLTILKNDRKAAIQKKAGGLFPAGANAGDDPAEQRRKQAATK